MNSASKWDLLNNIYSVEYIKNNIIFFVLIHKLFYYFSLNFPFGWFVVDYFSI